jgi:hypothetical protein
VNKTLLQITDFFESSLTLDIDVPYIFIHRVTTTVPVESSAVFVIICPVDILRPYTCFYPSTIGQVLLVVSHYTDYFLRTAIVTGFPGRYRVSTR